jgi:hypothetical protein
VILDRGPSARAAVIARAIPVTDHGEIRTLSQLLPSLAEAREIAPHLIRKMREVVVRTDGRVTAVETDGI